MDCRIEIDQDLCYGSAECVLRAGDAFALNRDGAAEVLAGAAGLSSNEMQEIVAACPSGAISLS